MAQPAGPSSWPAFRALSVLTMAVTYLLQVQEGISRRDAGILKLTTAAGQPPSALRLLERYADLDSPEEIRRVLYKGRDRCATVLQSHASHPSLIYFRSVGVGSGWPATLGAMLDLALMFELLIEDRESRAPAILLRSEGLRLIDDLNGLIGLEAKSDDTTDAAVPRVCARLTAAGYKVRSQVDAAEFAQQRRKHAGRVLAAAEHLGTTAAPLIP
ncbi:hypothetical protein [Bradyrhizobium sp. 45]|uniref:hypothetical protein n=2 Tax=Bradyrhizobium TaxID=374 RepID=UPI001FF8E6E6|nr:hypothetical protein [Bradyrhizobium sp. 45]